MIRIGIVGAGFIGTVHSMALEQLLKHGMVDGAVVGVHDVDPQRAAALAARHGAAVAASAAELIERVDALWVCTWTAAHRDLVEQAAARSVAVFCEKPLAPTWSEAQAVAAAMATVHNQVGLVLRTSPVYIDIAARVAAGDGGRHLATVFRDDQYFPIRGIYGSDWRGDPTRAGGGTLIEHSIHDVDLLRWFFGDPQQVTAHTTDRPAHAGIDDSAVVTFTYPDGQNAVLISVWHDVMSRASTRRLEIICAEAILTARNDQTGPLEIATSAGVVSDEHGYPTWVEDFDGPPALRHSIAGYAVANRAFLDALAAGRPGPGPDAATALAAHRLVEAAYRSARSGGAPVDPAAI